MSRILIIGSGGVGTALAHKCAQYPKTFSKICLASRNTAKCEKVRSQIAYPIQTAEAQAHDVDQLVTLCKDFEPDVVINAALPVHNLPIMDACLEAAVHYVDTSAPEPDPSRYELFSYRWQLDYDNAFKDRGIMGLLSIGFDPGITNVFCSYAAKHLYDAIHTIDILDCNGGSHGYPFATNFNPITNLLEVTQTGIYWEEGAWREVQPLSIKKTFDLQEIGAREMYLIYHEEMETLVAHLPHLKRLRFWMHFSEEYLEHLNVLNGLGLISLEPLLHEGIRIPPVEFLKELLPDPAALGSNYYGKTNIGCLFEGLKDGERKRYYLYNVSDHEACYRETRSQAISYTTAVAAMAGTMLMLNGEWMQPGVFLPESLDPDPLMELIPACGLPWLLEEEPQMETSGSLTLSENFL